MNPTKMQHLIFRELETLPQKQKLPSYYCETKTLHFFLVKPSSGLLKLSRHTDENRRLRTILSFFQFPPMNFPKGEKSNQ